MKNNKISHLYTYVFLLVLSFFLFTFKVNADTYNISFTSSNFDILSSTTFLNVKDIADNYCSSNNCTYMLTYTNNQGYSVNYYFPVSPTTNFILSGTASSMIYNLQGGGSWRNCRHNRTTGAEIACDLNQSYPSGNISFYFSNNSITSYSLLYSNLSSSAFTLIRSGSETANIYNLSYLNFSGSYSVSNPYIPSLYEIYNYVSPTPPDNTPILTDFYTLVIDKFSVVADFFTDNTYLFAIPLIPILVLCIYFIKRSLIK